MENIKAFIHDYIDCYRTDDTDWMDKAACRKVTEDELKDIAIKIAVSDLGRRGGRVKESINKPVSLFYPPMQKKDQLRMREAVAICARCDVKNNCLAMGLANEESFGVWGGKTPKELRQIAGQIRQERLKNGS